MRPLTLFALLAVGATAQPTAPPAARTGAWVRVETGPEVLLGRLVTPDSAGFLVVRTPEASRAIARESASGLWERVPAPGRGAWRGALLGGLVGGVALTALNYGGCEYDCDRALNAVAGVGVGAVVGGLAGATWGGLRGRWALRSP
ncbi:hypothetical protein [Rubrivirga marina]|uniref:Glycine zipper domain-containing protein n=1 Tax=Rubrivirga marina TaxID=1196024 RepID=A0A271J4C2_9BACT|nr:hypothetical protein [Rubrivirga marina]PAP78137.1 hypothetical protein BSZ37_17700 [Rubrivirga marina]